ncbi:hypothetical protein JXJ21_00765, partial [candidate division KSB1 bacterium]|nr:hypothetical protein [candidate division KSB1 bacterium]
IHVRNAYARGFNTFLRLQKPTYAFLATDETLIKINLKQKNKLILNPCFICGHLWRGSIKYAY